MAELLLVMCKIATMASRRQDGADDHPVSGGLTAARDFKVDSGVTCCGGGKILIKSVA
jgi:hypothetical protein